MRSRHKLYGMIAVMTVCRYEAAQLPDTMISTLDSSQYDDQRTSYVEASSTPSIDFQNLRPDWIRGFVNDFAQLRSDLAWYCHACQPLGLLLFLV